MMEFLYFPEDKSEYIPAFIMLVIFMILAIGAMVFFLKRSKIEEKKFEDEYMKDYEKHYQPEPKKDLDSE